MKKNIKPIAAKTAKEVKPAPAAQLKDDETVMSCRNAITTCREAIGQCEECANADDPAHSDAIAQCRAAIAQCAITVEDCQYWSNATAAESVTSCAQCAVVADQCAAACRLVSGECGSCSSATDSAASACDNCAVECRDNAGVDAETENDTEQEQEQEIEIDSTVMASSKSKPTAKAKPARSNWLKVVSADIGPAEIYISGAIGKSWFDDSGLSAEEFRNELENIPEGKAIVLHINSEGGSIKDGLEIYNILKARSEDVTAVIDGYALSVASLIALAADTVVTPTASVWMIHEPHMPTEGDAEAHRKASNALEKHGAVMADVYAQELGMTKDEMREIMRAETWFTGEEAAAFGLAELADDSNFVSASYSVRASVDLNKFNPPEKITQLIAGKFSTARLSSGVVGTAANKTTRKENTMKENTPVAAATAASPFETRLLEERKARITADVTKRAEGKIKNDKLQWWIDAAINSATLKEEQQVLAQIDELPVAAAVTPANAHNPLAPVKVEAASEYRPMAIDSRGQVVEIGVAPEKPRIPFARELRKLQPAERARAMARDWNGLLNYCMDADAKQVKASGSIMPVAANTFSSTLIADFLVDQAMTVLYNTWAPLSCFTRDFTVDRYKPLATAQVKIVTASGSTLTGTKSSPITSFESGNSTVRAVSVPMTHYSQPYFVSQDDLMSGLRLENLTTAALSTLADTITAAALAPITAGAVNSAGALVAYSAGTYWADPTVTVNGVGTFGWSNDMPRLRSYLKKSPIKNAILDGPFYSFLANQPSFFQSTMNTSRTNPVNFGGWNQLAENTKWPSTPANIGGFVCNPQAIAVAAGLPSEIPNVPGNTIVETTIQIPGPDIYIASYMWFSLAARQLWNSFDVVFGASGGDATAAAILFNGAGSRS